MRPREIKTLASQRLLRSRSRREEKRKIRLAAALRCKKASATRNHDLVRGWVVLFMQNLGGNCMVTPRRG